MFQNAIGNRGRGDQGAKAISLARRIPSATGPWLLPILAALPMLWLAVALILILSAGIARADGIERGAIRYRDPSLSLFQESGMLRSGRFSAAGPFDHEWVDHFGAFFTEDAALGDHLEIAVGLGGIFQFQKPEVTSAGWGGSQYRNFFVGPSRATLTWKLGDARDGKKPWLKTVAGMFPFKYNPDAGNLGEYLFRTNPYPGYIMTGGYAIIDNAGAYLQGANAELAFGKLTLNLMALTETTLPPLYDWSLAGLAKYAIGDGLLEVGAGVNFKRLVPVRPSRTAPERVKNAYFRKGGTWYTGNTGEYRARMEFAAAHGNAADSARYSAVLDSVAFWTTTDSVADPSTGAMRPYARPSYQYYSASGTVVMGRFSLDPKRLLPAGVFGREDLKLHGEAAMLGWKDYPVFYARKADRIPVMLGFNLPAFGVLDLVALQAEYFHSPYLNSTERVATVGMPQPFMPRGTDSAYSRNAYYDAAGKDDLSWSLLVKKEILPGVTLYSQVARDHLRMVSLNTWFGPALESDENLATSRDWYWMCRIGIAI